MRILYLNHYAGSPRYGMEYRPYYLAREWVRLGHEVRILAASYSHVRSTQPDAHGAEFAEPAQENVDGIDYRFYPTPAYVGNGVGRVLNIAAFLAQLARDARRIVAELNPDVVIASSTYPMDIWVARHLSRLAKATLVYEVHDLWPASPIELSGMSPRHPFILLCQKAENDAYRDADRVVSMLPKVAEHMSAHGLDLRKLHIVPNGIDPEEWQGAPADLREDVAHTIRSEKSKGRSVVVYAGSHGLPNALDVLLDAAKLVRDEALRFVVVGDGMEKVRLARRVESEGLSNVMMFSPIPKAQIPALLARADIAYLGWQRVSIYRFGIAPNKLMDYMMAGCPVLHSVEAGNDPVREADCGLTVSPEDPQAVAAGLRRLAQLPQAERTAMGERGRAYVTAHHTYPVLAARFLAALKDAP